jgi:esterase/lipase
MPIDSKKTNCVRFFQAKKDPTAVTLVAHGLNVKPERMESIVHWLIDSGSDVFLLRLAGHADDLVPIANVTLKDWKLDADRAWQSANHHAKKNSLPLYFVGYSFGALLLQYMIHTTDRMIHFDKQVLIAPATGVRTFPKLIRALFFLGDQFLMPSFTPNGYRHNSSLPIRSYKIMIHMEKVLRKDKSTRIALPTLIVIDPKDELVSSVALQKIASDAVHGNYSFCLLDSKTADRSTRYHHLIINESTMGGENWKKFKTEVARFLFNQTSFS